MSISAKAVVERWGKEIWNAASPDAVDEIVAANVVHHSWNGEKRGRDVITQAWRRWHTAFPDLRFTVVDIVAEGDIVHERWSFKGTHRGEWEGVPGTAKVVTFSGISTLRVAGDKVVETWVHFDLGAFLQQVGKAPSVAAASRAIIDRWRRIWNNGDLALIDEVVSDECVTHSSLRGDIRGRVAVRQSYERYHAAFPDMQFKVLDLVAEGDKIMMHWSFKGTHRGEWNGVAATGKPIAYNGTNVFRIEGGRIVENSSYWDMGAFLRQAGRMLS